MTDLYFLTPGVVTQIFNPTAELTISAGTSTNEANTEIKTRRVAAEKERRKYKNTESNLNL